MIWAARMVGQATQRLSGAVFWKMESQVQELQAMHDASGRERAAALLI
jgi:hypothetical protein